MKVSPVLRDQIRAMISNSYYDARNENKTMEDAADLATERVVRLIQAAPLIEED